MCVCVRVEKKIEQGLLCSRYCGTEKKSSSSPYPNTAKQFFSVLYLVIGREENSKEIYEIAGSGEVWFVIPTSLSN